MLLIVKFMELTKFLKNRIASAASDPAISLMGRFVQAYFFLRGQYYRASTRGILTGESWRKREKSVRSTFPVPNFFIFYSQYQVFSQELSTKFFYFFNYLSSLPLRAQLPFQKISFQAIPLCHSILFHKICNNDKSKTH